MGGDGSRTKKSKIGLTQKKSGKRFVAVSTEELSALEKTRNEQSTAYWAVKCFREFLKIKGEEVDFRTVSKAALNILLREFYGSVRNAKGQQYSINTYVGIRSGINRFISMTHRTAERGV